MSKRTDIGKLKERAADLRRIAQQSKTTVGRHVAEKMANEAERAAAKAEVDESEKA